MRLNGLYAVVELGARATGHPLIDRYKKAIVLGAMREDVIYVPLLGQVFEHLSLSHFYRPPLPGGLVPFLWPGPRAKGELFFGRALERHGEGERAAAFVQLGRVVHLLADMACPVHAHRTPHWTDPFEWYVEGNLRSLLALPVPETADTESASEIIGRMSQHCQRHRTDGTNHHMGRVMKRLGWRKPVTAREAGEQARDLIPTCAGHAASLFRLFLRRTGELSRAR